MSKEPYTPERFERLVRSLPIMGVLAVTALQAEGYTNADIYERIGINHE